MKFTIKSATLIDQKSPFNGMEVDVIIDKDQIVEVSSAIENPVGKVIEAKGMYLSAGWVDAHVQFGEPGHEERETFDSGCSAAAHGGFTSVMLTPEVTPTTDNKGAIEYIYSKTESQPINVYPLGAVTTQREGKDLAELFDMYQAGAIGFYEGKKEIKNANLLKIGLQYSSTFQAPIFSMPYDENLGFGGQMHEGSVSTLLGLKGIPSIAEEVAIQRDLSILEYTGGHLHIAGVSTAKGVERIREAKNAGLQVTASVALYSLLYTDEKVNGYDTNYKTLPPLRPQSDVDALIEAVIDGTLDVISTDHMPKDIEVKQCEFDHAEFGMAILETAFAGSSELIEKIGLEKWVEMVSVNPRRIFDLPEISVSEGNIAELTLFSSTEEWTLSQAEAMSKAVNNPMYQSHLKGRVKGIFNKGQYVSF